MPWTLSESEAAIWRATLPKVTTRQDDIYVLAVFCTVAAQILRAETSTNADLVECQELVAQLGLSVPVSPERGGRMTP